MGGGVPVPATPRRAEEQTAERSDLEGKTVYVTGIGTKYHRSSCQYLRQSRIPVSLKEAKQSYAPCSVCTPP